MPSSPVGASALHFTSEAITQPLRDLEEHALKSAGNANLVHKAFDALILLLTNVSQSGASLDTDMGSRISRLVALLVSTSALDPQQIAALRTLYAGVMPLVAQDPSFSTGYSANAQRVLGTNGKPEYNHASVEAGIINDLLTHTAGKVNAKATDLVGDLQAATSQYAKRRNRGIFQRLLDSIKRLFGKSSASARSPQQLGEKLTQWLEENKKDIGQISTTLPQAHFTRQITDAIFEQLADAKLTEKESDAIADTVDKAIGKAWAEASKNFSNTSAAALEEFKRQGDAIFAKVKNASDAPDIDLKVLAKAYQSAQAELSLLMQSMLVADFTPADLFRAVDDMRMRLGLVGSMQSHLDTVLDARENHFKRLQKDLTNFLAKATDASLSIDQLRQLSPQIAAAHVQILTLEKTFNVVHNDTDYFDTLIAGVDQANKALLNRCQAETTTQAVRDWYVALKEAVVHTEAKLTRGESTKFQKITDLLKLAPQFNLAFEAEALLAKLHGDLHAATPLVDMQRRAELLRLQSPQKASAPIAPHSQSAVQATDATSGTRDTKAIQEIRDELAILTKILSTKISVGTLDQLERRVTQLSNNSETALNPDLAKAVADVRKALVQACQRETEAKNVKKWLEATETDIRHTVGKLKEGGTTKFKKIEEQLSAAEKLPLAFEAERVLARLTGKHAKTTPLADAVKKAHEVKGGSKAGKTTLV